MTCLVGWIKERHSCMARKPEKCDRYEKMLIISISLISHNVCPCQNKHFSLISFILCDSFQYKQVFFFSHMDFNFFVQAMQVEMDSLTLENERKTSSIDMINKEKVHMSEKLREEEGWMLIYLFIKFFHPFYNQFFEDRGLFCLILKQTGPCFNTFPNA